MHPAAVSKKPASTPDKPIFGMITYYLYDKKIQITECQQSKLADALTVCKAVADSLSEWQKPRQLMHSCHRCECQICMVIFAWHHILFSTAPEYNNNNNNNNNHLTAVCPGQPG